MTTQLADQIWSVGLKVGISLLAVGLTALLGYTAKVVAGPTLLRKALVQINTMLSGLASNVTSGMSQAIQDAASDGQVTAAERSALIARLVTLLKSSAESQFLNTLQNLIGLQSGSAFENWLRGLAGDHIDAQLTSVSPVKPGITATTPKAAATAVAATAHP